MLALSVKPLQELQIGDDVILKNRSRAHSIKLAIQAPREVPIQLIPLAESRFGGPPPPAAKPDR
jgi:hypothetical protein